MKLTRRTTACVFALGIVGALLLISPLQAHHAQRPFYDYGAWIDVEGIVRRFDFRNPHPVLYLEVVESDGSAVEWKLLFPPASVLRRRGWTSEAFVPGERISARGHPSRQPGTYGLARLTITRADGTVAIGGPPADE